MPHLGGGGSVPATQGPGPVQGSLWRRQGFRRPLSPATSQTAAATPGRTVFPSQATARQPLWAHHLPTAFCLGVLLCLDKLASPTVQQCFYTPQGSRSVMKTKHSTLREKAGRERTGARGCRQATHGFLSGLCPKDGSSGATGRGIVSCHQNNDSIQEGTT